MLVQFSFLLATSTPVDAFNYSDGVGKTVVGLLFLGSVMTWFIMLERGVALLNAKRASEDFVRRFRDKKNVLAAFPEAVDSPSPVARVFESGAEQLCTFYGMSPEKAAHPGARRELSRELTTAELEAVRTALERSVSDQILVLEDKIGLLATAVSVSPFFGLFGTVWGVMVAFCGIASQGSAAISALAPGVSGALLTTVVGLLVAIPSLIGYNLLTITIRKVTVYMDNFAEEFMAQIKLEQLNRD